MVTHAYQCAWNGSMPCRGVVGVLGGNEPLQREVGEMGARRVGWKEDEPRARGMEGWFNF